MKKMKCSTITKILILGLLIVSIGILYNFSNKENFELPNDMNGTYYILCNNNILLNDPLIMDIDKNDNRYDALVVNPTNSEYINPPTKPATRYMWTISNGSSGYKNIKSVSGEHLAFVKLDNTHKLCIIKKKSNVNNDKDFDYDFLIELNENQRACKLTSKKFNKTFYQNKKDDYADLYNITSDNNTNANDADFNFIKL